MVDIESESPFIEGMENFLEKIKEGGGKLRIRGDNGNVRPEILERIETVAAEENTTVPLLDFDYLTEAQLKFLKDVFIVDS